MGNYQYIIDILNQGTATEDERTEFITQYRALLNNGYYITVKNNQWAISNKHQVKVLHQLNNFNDIINSIFQEVK
jgi:hypothetical protein